MSEIGRYENERLEGIDIAKGIAIFLMVIGHSYSSDNYILQWINSFHMPFFFLVTGVIYQYKKEKKGKLKINIANKAFNLLLPYIIWGSLIQIFFIILEIKSGNIELMRDRIMLIFTLNSSAMWFLPAMFINVSLFYFFHDNKYLGKFLFVVLTVIGFFCYIPNNTLISAFLRAFKYIGFIALGYYFSKYWRLTIKKGNYILIAILDIVLVYFSCNVLNNVNPILNFIIFMFEGCLGSFVLLQLCYQITKLCNNNLCVNTLKKWGKDSIIILCLHRFIVEIIRLIDYKLLNNVIFNSGIVEGLIIASLVMTVLNPLLSICDTNLCFLFGKKKYSSKNKRYMV